MKDKNGKEIELGSRVKFETLNNKNKYGKVMDFENDKHEFPAAVIWAEGEKFDAPWCRFGKDLEVV